VKMQKLENERITTKPKLKATKRVKFLRGKWWKNDIKQKTLNFKKKLNHNI
jgi:hypothetical protein